MPAHKRRLVVAPDAKRDIRAVLTYTKQEQQWGSSQRRSYRRFLDQAFVELARFPELGRRRQADGADVRSHRVGQHVVIDRVIGHELSISRVIHGQRDIESVLDRSEP